MHTDFLYDYEEEFYEDEREDGDCGGSHCGVIGCPSCDAEYYENYDCGKLSNGLCMYAGSEDCDFECPNR